MPTIESVATLLRGVRLKNQSYLCYCPNHKDDKPQLNLAEVNGFLVWKCKAGCQDEKVDERMEAIVVKAGGIKKPEHFADIARAEIERRALDLTDIKDLEEQKEETLFDKIRKLREFNRVHSIPFGIPLFDDALGKINPTDLILLTGNSGEGKTMFASHLAKQVCLEGKKVTFFSLESFAQEIESRLMYGMLSDRFYKDPQRTFCHIMYRKYIEGEKETEAALSKYEPEVEAEWKKIYRENLNMVYRDSSTFSIKEFEKLFAIHAKSSDLIVVDHLNYFDSHDEKKSENRVTEEIMKRIRDCVLLSRKPVLLLSHVRKKENRERKLLPDMEDIHGSSNIFKIATKMIILGLDYSNDDRDVSRTLVKIPKDRYGEGVGRYLFRMNFNIKTREYEGSYEVGKVARDKTGEFFQALEPGKIPRWVRGEIKKMESEL